MKAKKKIVVTFVVVLCMAFQVLPVSAQGILLEEFDPKPVQPTFIQRSLSEKEQLENIYKELYPDQYFYIENYEENGVVDMPIDQIYIVYSGSKMLGNATYDLVVYNNGQVFLNSIVPDENQIMTRSVTAKIATFKAGDMNKYMRFTLRYMIDNHGYDSIDSIRKEECDGGIYYLPINRVLQKKETISAPAQYGYNNVSLNNGNGPLYDLGVAVGGDQAKSITKMAGGADLWVWSILYQFIKP